ncbi:hypothetical protein ACROYT_G017844 [Oculina patagonica]
MKTKTRSRRSTTNKSTTDNTSKKDGGNIRLPSKKDVLAYTPPPFIGSWDEYDKFLRTGPGNPLEKQVKWDQKTGKILEIYEKPTGKTDAVSMQHDVDYSVCANKPSKNQVKCKNEADKKMVKALDAIPWKDRQWGHAIARNTIATKAKVGKAVVIERFNRTLKNKMYKQFTIQGNTQYLEMLPILVKEYNNTKHSSIKMTPTEASKEKNQGIVYLNLYGDMEPLSAKPKFKVGDKVRISKYKRIVFDKGYTPNWSEEMFVITKIQHTNPITYKIKDLNDEEIKGKISSGIKGLEVLQKINNPKILDWKINQYFQLVAANQRVRERYGDAVIDIPGHETVLRPKETLLRLCDHLQVTCSEDYIEKCSEVLYGTPSVTRDKVVWTEEQKARVTKIMKKYPFLKQYSFDDEYAK